MISIYFKFELNIFEDKRKEKRKNKNKRKNKEFVEVRYVIKRFRERL